jgi:hypothetical protein
MIAAFCFIEQRGPDHKESAACTHTQVFRVALLDEDGRSLLPLGPEFTTPRAAIDYANAVESGKAPIIDSEGITRDPRPVCLNCGRTLPAHTRADRKTCSNACRVALLRRRQGQPVENDGADSYVPGGTLPVTDSEYLA